MQSAAIKLKLIHFNGCRRWVFPSLFLCPLPLLKKKKEGEKKSAREKEAEGHLCNQPQPDTSTVITETLKNLHLAFKSLIREPLKGRLKSKIDHQTLKVFLKVSGRALGEVHPALRQQRREKRVGRVSSRISSGQQFEPVRASCSIMEKQHGSLFVGQTQLTRFLPHINTAICIGYWSAVLIITKC